MPLDSQNRLRPERRMVCFGSSRLQPGHPHHDTARAVGAALARNGWTVVSGGYAGAMGAVTEGARAAGGRAVGVTTTIFADREPHPDLDAVFVEPDYPSRLAMLCRQAHGFVVLPGGLGTLSEWITVWCLRSIDQVPAPLIVFEDPWRTIAEPVLALAEVRAEFDDLLHWVSSAEDVDRVLSSLRGDR